MTTFRPGDRVRHYDRVSSSNDGTVVDQDSRYTAVRRDYDNGLALWPNAKCTLIPPKVYAEVVIHDDGTLHAWPTGRMPAPSGAIRLGRISWDGETLAVEP